MNKAKDNLAARFFPGWRTKLKNRRGFAVLLGLFLALALVTIASADKGAVEINPRQISAIVLKVFGVNLPVDFTPLQEST